MSWQRQITVYDDAALADLTSIGLLRRARKQVDAGKVTLVASAEKQGTLTVGGCNVILSAGPLTEACCDCSATGVCVHILAAVLFIRERALPEKRAAADGAAWAPTTEPDLEQYTPRKIFKWAGKPATRLAARILAAVPEPDRHIENGTTSIKIRLGGGRQCRYVAGAGLDGVICEAPQSRRKGIIAACLLHWWQSRGTEIFWPDFVARHTPERPLSDGEKTLLQRIDAELAEMLTTGLMHLPRHTEDALRGLAWSARGEDLPRLSALVLRLADELAAFRMRKAGTDPQLLLDRLVAVKGLLAALSHSPSDHLSPLRGRFKRDYSDHPVGPLWLCGGYQYATRGDAFGICVLLWDLDTGIPLQVNIGRTGEAARTFNPQEAWQAVLAWQHGRSPATLNGRVLEIKGAKVSADGRLSQSTTTILKNVEDASPHQDRLEALGFRDWKALTAELTRRLGEPETPSFAVILRPRRLQAFAINELTQQWTGWIGDHDGRWLRLNLPVNADHDRRVKIINKVIDGAAHRIWGLVVDARLVDTELFMAPVSVIVKHQQDWVCLHPDLDDIDLKQHGRLGTWLRRRIGRERPQPVDTLSPPDLTGLHALFDRIQHKLLGVAELGLRCDYLETEPLVPLVRELQSISAPLLAKCLQRLQQDACLDTLVQAHYALGTARQQLLIQGLMHQS